MDQHIHPESLVPDNIDSKRINAMLVEKVEEMTKNIGDSFDNDGDNTVKWPETSHLPAKELLPGFFRQSFPKLFPNGKGDITCSRPGKSVPLHQWLKHLLRTDRRFANDPIFVMVASNIIQRHKALTLGNVYANKKASELTTEQLKEMVCCGDESVLKSLYCFTKSLNGSQK